MKKFRIFTYLLCMALSLSFVTGCSSDWLFGDGAYDGDSNALESGDADSVISALESSKTDTSEMDFEFTNRDNRTEYSEKEAVKVVFYDGSATVSGKGANVSGKTVTLTEETTYIISGSSSDGMLVVNCGEKDKVQIVFDGLTLKNKNGPAVYVKEGDKVVITLAEDSVNTIEDGSDYEYTDGSTNVDAAFFSKSDITFNGSGTLAIKANLKHGICSKDDLVITGGVYEVSSEKVAINGKDCVKIGNGTFTLKAGTDGIRSDNEEDLTRGYVYISGGKFDITSGNDGIQAQTVLKVDGGYFNIKSGGGSENASTTANGNRNENWGFGGNDFGGRPGQMRPGFRGNSGQSVAYSVSAANNSESAKGIKAGSDILIHGGLFNIDSADDSVHSNGTAVIEEGTFNITSGDDGIHADTALGIKGGSIVIDRSYEGLESSDLVVSGGNISVTATDDGMNAAGGNDGSSMGNRPGMGGFSKQNGRIAISGGYIVIDAMGDGVDANGTVDVSGGVTIVYGPSSGANSAFDYDRSAEISGGTFIALGSSGMAMSFSKAENQGVIALNLSGVNEGSSIALCDGQGKVVLSVNTKKPFGHIVLSCGGIRVGNEYTVVTGAEVNNTDTNGYAENTEKLGGTDVQTVELTSALYGASTHGMGGRP